MLEFPTIRTLSVIQALGVYAAFVAAACIIIVVIVRWGKK